jgi:NAD(P)-dependent dehydrogenase (short-subunit alcohol dehydrogenase family)
MGAYFSLRAPTRRPRRHRGGDRQGGELKSPECDVTNLSSVEALAALVEAESGRVDIW